MACNDFASMQSNKNDKLLRSLRSYIMSSEYTLEQEITLLEQDYILLTELQTELQQRLTIEEKNRPILQQKIADNDKEINEINQKLEQLKAAAGLVPHPTSTLPPATLHNVPDLPAYLVIDLLLFNELKAKLVIKPSLVEIAEGQKSPLLIQSPSGMGKSVIAAVLAHDTAIRRTFSDGIFWVHLGQHSDLISCQMELIRALGEEVKHFLNPQAGTERLRQLCAKRNCLLILDDVWDVDEVLAFNGLGKYCQLVITTCDNTLLDFLLRSIPSIQGYVLTPLVEEQAIQFFLNCTGQQLSPVPMEVNTIARACDYLPLALKLIAALASNQPASVWNTLVDSLQNATTNEFPDTHPRTLMQAMQLNVDALGEQSEYYLALAVFVNYSAIPQKTVVMLWQYLYHLSADQADAFINKLVTRGLLQVETVSSNQCLSLHAFQYDYLYTSAEVEKLHHHLLAAYRRHCPHGWSNGPNDGYFFEYLCTHLLAAERTTELKSLLLDFDWLYTKLQRGPLHKLLSDYDLFPDRELETIKKVLSHWVNGLQPDREPLANYLLSQLVAQPAAEIQKLLNQLKEISSEWQPPLS